MSNANNPQQQEQVVELQQTVPLVEKTEDEAGGGTGGGSLSVSVQEEIKQFHQAQKELAEKLFLELGMEQIKERITQLNALAAEIEPQIPPRIEVEEDILVEVSSISDEQYKKYQEELLRKKLQRALQEDESREADMGFTPE